ncbi:YwqI/YxiC family protein [Shouchella tritolerans]|uniref:YwqI/YxiC family protein n=1 Tax=Shouchella tritolerans TaxID=2979466 RepID=UPI0021E9775B|nr:YwqI/YxiC family protein [Shouchella tritolerans]
MSGEIYLNPTRMKENLTEVRNAIQAVQPSTKGYEAGDTVLEKIEKAKENMEQIQQLLRDYQALVLDNASDIEALVDQFVESEANVAKAIKGG